MTGCTKTLLREKLSKAHAVLASDAGPLIDRLIYEAGKAVVKPLWSQGHAKPIGTFQKNLCV